MNIKIGDYVETALHNGIVMDIISGDLLLLVDPVFHKSLRCVELDTVIKHVPKLPHVNYMFLSRIKRDHDKLSRGESL